MLPLPSIIKCNIEEIEPIHIRKKIGEISECDMRGLLVNLIKVCELELIRERQKHQVFEM